MNLTALPAWRSRESSQGIKSRVSKRRAVLDNDAPTPDNDCRCATAIGGPSNGVAVEACGEGGVTFQRDAGMEQNELGIWESPGGARITWFKDPDGNTLSLSQS